MDPSTLGGGLGTLGAALGGPLGWATLGVGALGGLFGGLSQQQQQQQQLQYQYNQMAQQNAQFNRQQNQSEGQTALGVARSLDAAPLRDRAMYLMNARMGQTPGSFAPGNMFSRAAGQPASIGGVDPSSLAGINSQYTEGAGGTGGSQALARAYLAKLGYGIQGAGQQGRAFYGGPQVG